MCEGVAEVSLTFCTVPVTLAEEAAGVALAVDRAEEALVAVPLVAVTDAG